MVKHVSVSGFAHRSVVAAVVGLFLFAASAQANSLGFSFGDGTQGPTSGSVGPGAAQPASTWNIVNATPLYNGIDGPPYSNEGLTWPNNSNRGDGNFWYDTWTGDLGAKVSDGSTLGAAVQITFHDPNQGHIWDSWTGGWGGRRCPPVWVLLRGRIISSMRAGLPAMMTGTRAR